MDPEAIQRWADANRAYLALENEVARVMPQGRLHREELNRSPLAHENWKY